MTTSPGEGDETNESSYTDMQIHDSELPEELQPKNDLDPNATSRPPGVEGNSEDPGVDDQQGQVSEGTQTGSDGDAAASDAPASPS